MALTVQEFIEKTGAEVTGGNLIVGVGGDRRKLGDIASGALNLTRYGTDVMEALMNAASAEQAIADATVAEAARLEAQRRGKPLDQQ